MSKKESTRIPEPLLDQISEWSCGGFMLFNFDEEGNPQVYSKVESEKKRYVVAIPCESLDSGYGVYEFRRFY